MLDDLLTTLSKGDIAALNAEQIAILAISALAAILIFILVIKLLFAIIKAITKVLLFIFKKTIYITYSLIISSAIGFGYAFLGEALASELGINSPLPLRQLALAIGKPGLGSILSLVIFFIFGFLINLFSSSPKPQDT